MVGSIISKPLDKALDLMSLLQSVAEIRIAGDKCRYLTKGRQQIKRKIDET